MTPDPDALVEWDKPAPEQPAYRRRGRPPKPKSVPLCDTDGDPIGKIPTITPTSGGSLDPEDRAHAEAINVRGASLIGGVNVTWLGQAFRIDNRTARKRLAGLKPIGIGTRGDEIYDFVDAATYLAPPQRDKFARWIGTLRTSDLPTQLQDSYWAAMRKRQIWEQNAGELWKTSDVAEVLSEVFKTLKSNMQLWVDNLDAHGDMPEDQRAQLQQMVDGLQTELHQGLLGLQFRKSTRSSLYDPEVITNQDGIDEGEDLIG